MLKENLVMFSFFAVFRNSIKSKLTEQIQRSHLEIVSSMGLSNQDHPKELSGEGMD
jgi:tRNA A37 threonylcarbamoyladenosine dehydratase